MHTVELTFSPMGFDLASSCCCSLLPALTKLDAVAMVSNIR